MNSITITYGSISQSIQDWGFTYCTLHLRSRAASTLILDTAGGNPTLAAAIPYGGWILVTITMGDTSTYTFYGKRRDFNARAYPDAPATSMQFEDVWGALDRTIFQHYWSMSNGSGGLENKYFSRLNLFQDISAGPDVAWVYLTADNQIKQIIDFAQTQCSLPIQYGEVDPVWNMPVMSVKAISCAYALQLVMKPMPDMVTSMDYSTTLDGSPCPTLSFIARQNCTPVTLPFAGTDANGRHHKQTDIKPRPDLQVPAVVIQYQITGTFDGNAYDDATVDAYPPSSTGLAENSMVFPVDLRGPSQTLVKATLKAVAIDPTTAEFWQTNKPDLNDPNIVHQTGADGAGLGTQGFDIIDVTINGGGSHPDGISILDAAGETVALTGDEAYPNKLLPSGSGVATWMTDPDDDSEIEAVPVTIRATVKYNVKNPANGQKLRQVDRQVVECRLALTNAPNNADPGTTYTTVGTYSSGDPIPEQLAYFIWCSVNNVAVNYVDGVATPPEDVPAITDSENFQWEGEHEIVEETIYSIITPANTLNISGGNTDWESMNAVIYAVDIDFFKGASNVQFGPFKHLQAAAYYEMVTAFRLRQVYDNPDLRNNGQSGSAGGTDVSSGGMAKENTTHQVPQQSVHTAVSPPDGGGSVVIAQHDANTNGGQVILQTVKSDGTLDTTLPQVQLSQTDLGTEEDEGEVGRIAKWRLMAICDSSGSPMQAMVAMSEPEDLT